MVSCSKCRRFRISSMLAAVLDFDFGGSPVRGSSCAMRGQGAIGGYLGGDAGQVQRRLN